MLQHPTSAQLIADSAAVSACSESEGAAGVLQLGMECSVIGSCQVEASNPGDNES